MRKIYLSNVPPEEAFQKWCGHFTFSPKTEVIETKYSRNRITAEAVYAKYSSPNFNASAMDGIAVIAQNTFGADETTPKTLTLGVDFVYVDTGDPIVEPYNGVIMIEDVEVIDDSHVQIIRSIPPWHHVRPMGEDIVAKEMILPPFHAVRSMDIGAMLSSGVMKIEVLKQVQIGILPTGDEIVEPMENIVLGEIFESNSYMLSSMVEEYGGIPKRYPVAKDSFEIIKDTISKMVDENDIIIVNAGSSAGREDFTASAMAELGEVIVHGVATKPGKPTVLGVVKGKPIIGIPGYPVAAYYIFERFVKPLLFSFQKQRIPEKMESTAVVSKRMMSPLSSEEFVPVKLGIVDNCTIATPLNRGSGIMMSLVRADGFLTIDPSREGLEAGETATIQLVPTGNAIEKTLVSIGSHDLLMDVIASMMQVESDCSLSSSHVGSMGGIMALRRGETHIAPIHLLEEETGVYNLTFIQRYLCQAQVQGQSQSKQENAKRWCLVKGVRRTQGLIVKPNNPKKIQSIADLNRSDVQFVNRQNGSGTRLLLDFQLKQLAISSDSVLGYEREMTTHMAVAAAVASGSADCGLAVLSAAKALDLNFIPVGFEEYDFVMEEKMLQDERVQLFLKILTSESFKAQLTAMGGYSFEETGSIKIC